MPNFIGQLANGEVLSGLTKGIFVFAATVLSSALAFEWLNNDGK